MPFRIKHILAASVCVCGAAMAGSYNNSANYNAGYGMSAGQENEAANPNLRDSNGNLTIINGQITSATFGQTGVQSASTLSSYYSGTSSSTSSSGTATAIGNSLNVITVGNNNTVIVNSTQTNTGNVTATTTVNGSSN